MASLHINQSHMVWKQFRAVLIHARRPGRLYLEKSLNRAELTHTHAVRSPRQFHDADSHVRSYNRSRIDAHMLSHTRTHGQGSCLCDH